MSATNIRLEPSKANISRCAQLLSSGELVSVPTETVYGLAGNALNEESVHKIFEVKGRPLIDPLICHFYSIEAASSHIELNESALKVAEKFCPGPLTLVLNKKTSIPDLVTAGLKSAAIRIPAHPILRELLAHLKFPLAAPSANPFGYVSPTRAEHVEKTLGNKIQAILDAGPCQYGVESTIIDLRDPDSPTLLRHGPVTKAEIENTLGKNIVDKTHSSDDSARQTAPGLLTQHYSPRAKVILHPHNDCSKEPSETDAVVLNGKPSEQTAAPNLYWLSEDKDNSEIAHNLFELLQKLDNQEYLRIHVELSDGIGIGKAINDRLTRAAANK